MHACLDNMYLVEAAAMAVCTATHIVRCNRVYIHAHVLSMLVGHVADVSVIVVTSDHEFTRASIQPF